MLTTLRHPVVKPEVKISPVWVLGGPWSFKLPSEQDVTERMVSLPRILAFISQGQRVQPSPWGCVLVGRGLEGCCGTEPTKRFLKFFSRG